MRFEPNRHIVLNYAVRNFRTGQTVNVSVYDENGTAVLASTSMTELGSTGIYVKRWTPGKKGTFFAYADCVEYPKKAFQTLVVGGKPGDMKMGGLMPRGIESVWSQEEKKLLMNVVGGMGKKQNLLHENQIKFEKNIAELSKLKEEGEKEISKRFDNLAIKINSNSKTYEKNLNLIKRRDDKRINALNENFRKTFEVSNEGFNSLKKDIHERIDNLNLATDDVNVSLKSLNLEYQNAGFFPSIPKELADELLIELKGGKNGNTINGSS